MSGRSNDPFFKVGPKLPYIDGFFEIYPRGTPTDYLGYIRGGYGRVSMFEPPGVLADVVTKLPSLELSIVVERPTMIVGGLGPYTQVHFLL